MRLLSSWTVGERFLATKFLRHR